MVMDGCGYLAGPMDITRDNLIPRRIVQGQTAVLGKSLLLWITIFHKEQTKQW
jgi:hypothetical protein